MTTVEDTGNLGRLIFAAEAEVDQGREQAFHAGFDDAMAGHANGYTRFEGTLNESAYCDGYTAGVFDRVQKNEATPTPMLAARSEGRRGYKAKHRRAS